MIRRYLQAIIQEDMPQGLVSIIYGARQTGKTTLAMEIAKSFTHTRYLNCDEPAVRRSLTNVGSEELRLLLGDADLVVIDEAQRIENIGITAKLIHDNKLTPNLLLTGSSSLDLANKIKEPLTGRAMSYILQPLSIFETADNYLSRNAQVDRHLLYGAYPGIWQLSQDLAETRLKNIASEFLYRDAFNPNTIYDTTLMHRLLQFLALQVGAEVSYDSLAGELRINRDTVMRYIDLLEKAFIIYRVNPYRRNMRSEIGRLRKVYFYDLGIRNGLLEDFRPMHLRQDSGALWENFVFNELRKVAQSKRKTTKFQYWRSRRKLELDVLASEGERVLWGGEIKYKKAKFTVPKEFRDLYGDTEVMSYTSDNFLQNIEKALY